MIQWFEAGGELKIPDDIATTSVSSSSRHVQNLMDHIGKLGVANRKDEAAAAAAAEMILEGLWAHRRVGRSEERGFYAEKPQRAAEPRERENPNRPRRTYN